MLLFYPVQQQTRENCQFPSWVQTHSQWYTLDQSSIYRFEGDRFQVTNYSASQQINSNGPDSLAMTASCTKVLENEPGYRAAIVIHSRSGWYVNVYMYIFSIKIQLFWISNQTFSPICSKIGYQCMLIYKRDADILEVQFGKLQTISCTYHPLSFKCVFCVVHFRSTWLPYIDHNLSWRLHFRWILKLSSLVFHENCSVCVSNGHNALVNIHDALQGSGRGNTKKLVLPTSTLTLSRT